MWARWLLLLACWTPIHATNTVSRNVEGSMGGLRDETGAVVANVARRNANGVDAGGDVPLQIRETRNMHRVQVPQDLANRHSSNPRLGMGRQAGGLGGPHWQVIDEETEPDADVWRQYYSLYPENVNLTEHVYPPWFSPTKFTNATVQPDDIPFETYYYTGMIIAIP
ncbi:unnamed protein product, partial [Mesorhabditis spiculigera]